MSSKLTTQCSNCGFHFDPEYFDCWCPNPGCGVYNGKSVYQSTTSGLSVNKNVCPSCYSIVRSADRYCQTCGLHFTTQEDAGRSSSTTIGARELNDNSELPVEYLVKLSYAERTYFLTEDEVFGKQLRLGIYAETGSELRARRIHRKHVVFRTEGNDVYIHHLGEAIVRVNGVRLSPGESQLVKQGDALELSEVAELRINAISIA